MNFWLLSSSSGKAKQICVLMPVRFSLWLFLHRMIPTTTLASYFDGLCNLEPKLSYDNCLFSSELL